MLSFSPIYLYKDILNSRIEQYFLNFEPNDGWRRQLSLKIDRRLKSEASILRKRRRNEVVRQKVVQQKAARENERRNDSLERRKWRWRTADGGGSCSVFLFRVHNSLSNLGRKCP